MQILIILRKLIISVGIFVGDYILKEVADVLHQQVQKEMTGQPGTVEIKQFIIDSQLLKTTCSFGVQTIYKRNGINTVDKVVELVDSKLYQAKNIGRNRVIV